MQLISAVEDLRRELEELRESHTKLQRLLISLSRSQELATSP